VCPCRIGYHLEDVKLTILPLEKGCQLSESIDVFYLFIQSCSWKTGTDQNLDGLCSTYKLSIDWFDAFMFLFGVPI
jgi:hypothetical protein